MILYSRRIERVIVMILISMLLILSQDNLWSEAENEDKLKYTWLENHQDMDFVVGISIDNKPVCTGALINPFLVITAANPFHYRIPDAVKLSQHEVKVHLVQYKFDESNSTDVVCIEYQYKAHNAEWDPFGPDETKWHSARHDLAILTLKHNISYIIGDADGPQSGKDRVRFPFYKYLVREFYIYRHNIIRIAGHGFMDKVHVKQNIELDMVEYVAESVLESCAEWFPVTWGYFFCFLNKDNFSGINAGAVLTQGDLLIGIGSFSLTKGEESILVFTSMRTYAPGKMKYCKLDPGDYALEPIYNITEKPNKNNG